MLFEYCSKTCLAQDVEHVVGYKLDWACDVVYLGDKSTAISCLFISPGSHYCYQCSENLFYYEFGQGENERKIWGRCFLVLTELPSKLSVDSLLSPALLFVARIWSRKMVPPTMRMNMPSVGGSRKDDSHNNTIQCLVVQDSYILPQRHKTLKIYWHTCRQHTKTASMG